MAILIAKLRVERKPIVWTVHNPRPHEDRGMPEKRLYRLFEKSVAFRIFLNESGSIHSTSSSLVIPHGLYRDWYGDGPDLEKRIPDRVLLFGRLRPYKDIESLIGAFKSWPNSRSTLHIVGKPVTREYQWGLEDATLDDSRITLEARFLEEETLLRELAESGLVVMPYRDLNNSGALLLALSMNRPVLVPRNSVSLSLQQEFGPSWVYTFDAPLAATDIADALDNSRQLSGSPASPLRDWSRIGAMHVDVYRRVVDGRKGDEA